MSFFVDRCGCNCPIKDGLIEVVKPRAIATRFELRRGVIVLRKDDVVCFTIELSKRTQLPLG